MKPASIFLLLYILISCGCQASEKQHPHVKRDTTINKRNAYSDLFLDSAKLSVFISTVKPDAGEERMLRNFYNRRNYQFAWFTGDGPAEHTLAFWNLHQSHVELSKDSMLINATLFNEMEALLGEDSLIRRPGAKIADTELMLTLQFFRYVESAYAGKINPEEMSWHIPRRKVDQTELLDSLISGQPMEHWEPVNPQYDQMKDKLAEIYALERSGNWAEILSPGEKSFIPGDSSLIISQLKKRLISVKNYSSPDTSATYVPEFTDAVNLTRKQYGLPETGVIDAPLISRLNVPPKVRIRQMLINMERMRWFPRQTAGKYILVNIPEFKLHVIENSKEIFDIDIIVGKTATRTIIFNGLLKYVVFSPYWNVPQSIVRNEILPALKRNSQYLRSNNMEQTGFEAGLPVIRQRPGPDNSLGKVKFIFPNIYNIYLHDTPAKSLFKQERRAFSHGCIRLAEPRKLARYLLKNQKEWTDDQIKIAMNARNEKWVILKESLPIAITYFTAWVGVNGHLNFREDIYGHDQKMADLLFASGN
jgi:L,D-transpeptidase YcbB